MIDTKELASQLGRLHAGRRGGRVYRNDSGGIVGDVSFYADNPGPLPPLEIVAFVGDNIQDFPSLSQALRNQPDEAFAAFGTRFFALPNPMYGSWEPN